MEKDKNTHQKNDCFLELNRKLYFNPLFVISTVLFLSLSQSYAMNQSDDDWETHSTSPRSQTDDDEPRGGLSSERMRELTKRLVKLYVGNEQTQDVEKPKPGKVKIPESLIPFFKKRVDQFQQEKENERNLYIDVPSVPEENVSSNPTQAPVVDLVKTEKDGETLKSTSSFEERLQDVSLRANTLEALGLEVNEDNLASLFLEPEELYKRLANNFHGPVLVHDRADLSSARSIPIFNGLVHTKSVKVLSLKDAFLKNSSYFALGQILIHNRSLKQLNLSGVSWTPQALFLLATALENQRTLREIILLPKTTFTRGDVEEFYRGIVKNTGLRFICWPKTLKTKRIFGFGESEQSTFEVLEELSQAENHVAALHLGMTYAKGFAGDLDLEKAISYLKRAHTLDHPLASFELGRLHEKQGSYEKALKWYHRAVDKKNPRAFAKIGDYYRAVWPMPTKALLQDPDYKKAFSYYTYGAQQGDAKCLYRIGRMYESGKHVAKDLSQAASYYYQSSQWGYAEAFIALGALYRNPEFVGKGDHLENEETANYYLRWAERFPRTKGIAQRFLTY